jgi:hypothetical protein
MSEPTTRIIDAIPGATSGRRSALHLDDIRESEPTA